MTTLSTHVLDTAAGSPARSMAVTLWQEGLVLFQGRTDTDGRCPELAGLSFAPGHYRLEFAVAAHYRAAGHDLPDPPFLDLVTIDFGMTDQGHYHVPLLVSPYGYSTYRGS